MADDTTQRLAHQFFSEHLESGEPFTLEDLSQATGWEGKTLSTYLYKQYKGLIEKVPGNRYRVADLFRKYATWRRFKALVTQVRTVVTNYEPTSYKVLIYDFLMPLTNEEHLRMTLDSLFRKDRLLVRLRTIGLDTLAANIARAESMNDDEYLGSILELIEARFVGYSISHVDGRFRSASLLTGAEAAALESRGQRYLVDETTAITRFIFPYADDQELGTIKYLFQNLFIRSIIQLVNGEEQIWMVQSGSAGSELHIWQALTE
ncbi:MAG: hypothetical protein JW395_1048 [Nitrospira sp.]|nr:hypothetical protein [Nitrospira sp.]